MSDTSTSSADRAERAKPESFRGRNLAASFTVNDLTKSLAWYCDVIGFTIHEKYDRGGKLQAASLKAGDVRILLGQDDGAKGWERTKGVGCSLQIETAQDINELAARIKAQGGTLESEPMDMPWGSRVFRVADPDGFKIAISSERT
ncbi:MAG: VOC family protein [Gemmatimonadota bacterium]|nr:VOC family protein [Gemmatimonadota bacterium]